MKLYILKLEYNKINTNDIKKYNYKEVSINYIISKEGLYKYTTNSINRIEIIDLPTTQFTIKEDVQVVCDNSEYIIGDDWFQIPTNSVEDNIRRLYYRMRPNALVDLIIEINKNTGIMSSLYFKTNEKTIPYGVEEDIISFLSMLKNY